MTGNRTETPERADITLANWRVFPAGQYSFQHVSEFVPVAGISWPQGIETPSPGPGPLESVEITDTDGSKIVPTQHFARSYADHFVAMRDGDVVAEWIAPHADPSRPHVIPHYSSRDLNVSAL